MTLWIKEKPGLWHGKVVSFDRKTTLIRIAATDKEAATLLAQKSAEDPDAKVMGNFGIPEGSIFFTTAKIKFDSTRNEWVILPEEVFFQVQRRKDPRVLIQNHSHAMAFVGTDRVQIQDISCGGIGLKGIDPRSLPLFTSQYVPLRIVLNDQTIICHAEVRWFKDVDPAPKSGRAGFKFHIMTAENREFLSVFIFELGMQSADES